MASISKTDRCTERSILALLSAYSKHLVTFKLKTSQVVPKPRKKHDFVIVMGQQLNNIRYLIRFREKTAHLIDGQTGLQMDDGLTDLQAMKETDLA